MMTNFLKKVLKNDSAPLGVSSFHALGAESAKKQRGQIIIIALLFMAILLFSSASLVGYAVLQKEGEAQAIRSDQGLFLAEGGIDKAIYQLNQNSTYSGETGISLGAGQIDIAVANIDASDRLVTVTANIPSDASPQLTRVIKTQVNLNSTVIAFNYAIQIGTGGMSMSNGSSANGNVYSNGTISGTGTITGDAVVAGASNSLNGISVGGNAYAHSIINSTITKDAYYQNISGSTVGGTSHPGSTDQPTKSMPISAAQITAWEEQATAGGVISGNQNISGTQSIGPKEIDGNLTIGGTLNMTGIIWVKGNITFSNNANLTIDPSLGGSGTVLIADNPSNLITSSLVSVSNNSVMTGDGNPTSFPLVLSTNTTAAAVSFSNNSQGGIYYAANGGASLSNNAFADELTANSIVLSNNAKINYTSNLSSASFSSGPGGAWQVTSGTYVIVK